jgi:hypothetical protein
VDRTYVLADPMMNRNASYVALTRHREGVQVYTGRATFADREQLDRSLSHARSKDLARDYAAAAIERHAARLAPLADQARTSTTSGRRSPESRPPSRTPVPRLASSAKLTGGWSRRPGASIAIRPRQSSA